MSSVDHEIVARTYRRRRWIMIILDSETVTMLRRWRAAQYEGAN